MTFDGYSVRQAQLQAKVEAATNPPRDPALWMALARESGHEPHVA